MRKSIITILIVAVLCASVVLMTACNDTDGMFRRNPERSSKQITALSTFGDRVAFVDVNEVYASFYSYYQYMYQYYQYGVISAQEFQKIMDNLDKNLANSNESLARNALYGLKCIDYMYNYYSANCSDKTKVDAMVKASTAGHTYDFGKMQDGQMKELARFYTERNAEILAILSCYKDYSYVNAAVNAANKSMQDLFDNYVKEIRAEYDALESKDDPTPSGYVNIELESKPIKLVYEVGDEKLDTTGMKVNAVYEDGSKVLVLPQYLTIEGFDSKSAKEEQTITVTYGKFSRTFDISIVAARPSRDVPAKEEDKEEEDNSVKVDAYSFTVSDSDYIKDDMTDDQRIEANQELKIARSAMKRLQKYLADNYRTYDMYLYNELLTQVKAAVADVITAQVTITQEQLQAKYDKNVAAEYEGYLSKPYDKSTLDKRDTIVHPTYTDKDGNAGYGHYTVAQVLFKFEAAQSDLIKQFENEKTATEEAILAYSLVFAQDIHTWLSNPDYDAEATCEDENCNCPHCPNYKGDRVEYTDLDAWYSCSADCTCVACPCNKYQTEVVDGVRRPVSVKAVDVIDDIVTDLQAAVAEGYDLSKYMETINNWAYKANEDDGVFDYIDKSQYGYIMTPEDVESGMVDSFDKACRTLAKYNGVDIPADVKEDLKAEGIYILSAKGGLGSYAYCVSEYGIHFVTLTSYVADPADENVTMGQKVGDTQYVQLGLNYVINAYEYEEVTEGNRYKVVNGNETYYLAKGTLAASLYDGLYDNAVKAATDKFEKDFYRTIDDDDIKLYPDGYAYLIKQIKGE